MARESVDVIIAGGGMVGSTLALALGQKDVKVALVEAHEPEPWRADKTYLRVSAITVASQHLLERLDVWDDVAGRRAGRFTGIAVWDAERGGHTAFDAADTGESHLGHIVENDLLVDSLLKALRHVDAVHRICPAKVEAVNQQDDKVVVSLSDGRRLDAALLVAADGARSHTRELLGIGVSEKPYHQAGLVTTISTSKPHDEIARQRFLAGGPLALLPLADGRCSIVWSQPEDEAAHWRDAGKAEFLAALNVAAEGMLGEITDCGERACFPLKRQHAERYVSGRGVLIGDAAHVIHPLAGQGVNLGLGDAAVLAQEILAAVARGRDPGAAGLLRRYERRRRGENQLMQSAMDGFHWLFANNNPLLSRLRSVGLDVTQKLPPAKHAFMHHAMGMSPLQSDLRRAIESLGGKNHTNQP